MDYVTNEPIEVFSQLVVPIILIAIGGLVPAYITRHSKRQEKTKYIKILRANFPIIDAYLTVMRDYRSQSLATIPFFLAIGILLGVLVAVSSYVSLVIPFVYILDTLTKTNYIGGHLLAFFNKLGLLDLRLVYFSYLYIVLIIIIFLTWTLWIRFTISKKINLPKINWHNSKNQKKIVFPSISWKPELVYTANWVFIGIIFGIHCALFLIFFSLMTEFSIIPDHFSYDLTSFKTVYLNFDEKTAYFKNYKIVFFVGLAVSFVVMLTAYLYNMLFFNEVKRLFTNYFKYDFPEVKIRTENCEVKGQIKEILDKSSVTVSEKNVIKIIPWDKIEVIEAINKDRNT